MPLAFFINNIFMLMTETTMFKPSMINSCEILSIIIVPEITRFFPKINKLKIRESPSVVMSTTKKHKTKRGNNKGLIGKKFPMISTGNWNPLLLEPFRHVEIFIEHMSDIFLVRESLEKWKNGI